MRRNKLNKNKKRNLLAASENDPYLDEEYVALTDDEGMTLM